MRLSLAARGAIDTWAARLKSAAAWRKRRACSCVEHTSRPTTAARTRAVAGIMIPFSCTWYEKRKNDKDDAVRVNANRSGNAVKPRDAEVTRPKQAGRAAIHVESAQNRISRVRSVMSCGSFRTGDSAH